MQILIFWGDQGNVKPCQKLNQKRCLNELAMTKDVWPSHGSLIFLSGSLAGGWRKHSAHTRGTLASAVPSTRKALLSDAQRIWMDVWLHSDTCSNVTSSNKLLEPFERSLFVTFLPVTLFFFFNLKPSLPCEIFYVDFVNTYILSARMSDLWGRTCVTAVHLWLLSPRLVVSFSEMPTKYPLNKWINGGKKIL